MTGKLRIECNQWLSGRHGSDAERAMLSDLSIFVDGLCATQIAETWTDQLRQSVRVSALALAEWFATNWWRLRWEPETRTSSWQVSHKLGGAGRGYSWPDLSFSCDGETVLVSSRPTDLSNSHPIRYLAYFNRYISVDDFEQGVDAFVNTAVERLTGKANTKTGLSVLWKELSGERLDSEATRWRTLEACMGYDADESPPGLVDSLQGVTESYGESAVHEMASASRDQAVAHMRALQQDAGKRADNTAEVSDFDRIRKRIEATAQQSAPPWKQALDAARIAREEWALDPGPISTSRLSELLAVHNWNEWEPNQINGQLSAGFRDHDTPNRLRISLSGSHPQSRRFALSRLVADHFVSPDEESLLPVTTANTSSQKFQRVFAQGLLCRFEDLMDFLGTLAPYEEDLDDAAAHFDVSPLLIGRTLVNNGIPEREEIDAVPYY